MFKNKNTIFIIAGFLLLFLIFKSPNAPTSQALISSNYNTIQSYCTYQDVPPEANIYQCTINSDTFYCLDQTTQSCETMVTQNYGGFNWANCHITIQCPSQDYCTDSDGIDYYTAGHITYFLDGITPSPTTLYDFCDGNIIDEYKCTGNGGGWQINTYHCPYGCANGECTGQSCDTSCDQTTCVGQTCVDSCGNTIYGHMNCNCVPDNSCASSTCVGSTCVNNCGTTIQGTMQCNGQQDFCTDTDGLNHYTAGITTYFLSGVTNSPVGVPDYCNGNYVYEGECLGTNYYLRSFICPQGCTGGRCNGPACDTSCESSTCVGSNCVDSCGNTIAGHMNPDNSCASSTCVGSTCVNNCGTTIQGTKNCATPAKCEWYQSLDKKTNDCGMNMLMIFGIGIGAILMIKISKRS